MLRVTFDENCLHLAAVKQLYSWTIENIFCLFSPRIEWFTGKKNIAYIFKIY